MRIITIPGSLRAGSYNRKLILLANDILRKANVEVEALDLKDYPLPPYDGDLEDAAGLPDHVRHLQAKIAAGHGVLISSPEYNSGIPGTFKNILDWTSRGGGNPWGGKVIGLMGVTTGMWGTQRGMPHLRVVMSALGSLVIPQQINLPRAAEIWNDNGKLIDDKLPGRIENFVSAFLSTTEKLNHEHLSGE
jgi:NAD(P)H-dependent FMN reductase